MKSFSIILLICFFIVSCSNPFKSKIVKDNFLNNKNCYIFLNIKNKDSLYTIVESANVIYVYYNYYQHEDSLSKENYINLIERTLYKNDYVNVSDSFLLFFYPAILNKDLIAKYDNVDLINSNLIINNCLNDSLSTEDKKAVIYILLKKELKNCCLDCETGVLKILDTKYK